MINTLNETQLHRTLKEIYRLQNKGSRLEVSAKELFGEESIQKNQKETKKFSGNTESDKKAAEKSKGKTKGFIFDIVTPEGNVIEIQTGNLSHLLEKIQYVIDHKTKITVVYPLAVTKYIETYEEKPELKQKKLLSLADDAFSYGEFTGCTSEVAVSSFNQGNLSLVSRRKSPSKANFYSSFKEMTGICSVLLNKYFTLEILEISLIEERLRSDEKKQSMNNRRRFRKNWIKQGKRLKEISATHKLHGKKSFLKLLPRNMEAEFTVTELYEQFQSQNVKLSRNDVQLLTWVYFHAGIFEQIGKKGNAFVYRILQ